MRKHRLLIQLSLALVVGAVMPASARVRHLHPYAEHTESGSPISAGDNDVRIDADGQVITSVPPPPPDLSTTSTPKR